MLFEKSYNEILADSIKELAENTRISSLSPGSKALTLLEIVSRNLNEAYKTFDLNLARAFVSGANGKYLDLLGELLGLERIGSRAASASTDTKSVKFFVESGTFGSINSGSSITIPTGTLITSEANGQGIRYRVIGGIVLPAATSEAFVPVEAVLPGSRNNVGDGVLRFHSFANYSDVVNDSLKVNNVYGIFTGRDLESDTNFRFRLSRQVTAAEAANETAIRLAALSAPGVADVVIEPFARGIGTYDVIIKSITPSVSPSLIDAVQAAIELKSALGTVPMARKPIETGLTFEINIKYRASLPSHERSEIESRIRSALVEYVNGLDVGESFVINEAVQRVMEVDERIKDIGIPGKPFTDISIYKQTRLQDNKSRSTLIKNYEPDSDERIIIEPSITTPIVITAE